MQPTNGMIITENTIFDAGVFYLPDGIQIAADDITVQGDNTTIISDKQSGSGIKATGHSGITIQNLSIKGYYHGIRVDDGQDITIENITIRDTQEIEGIETFLHLWKPIDETYGGAILMNNCRDSHIRQCDAQHQMNGILLYHCQNMTVENNNASFNSGWGIYLSDTNESLIQDNHFDFCNRVFRRSDGSIRVEADAAGMVLVKGSSRNHFLRNSCLCGGDGIFLCGYEHPGMLTPCNDNLFEENDCRLSPNNAIESTFSGGNIYRRNDCSRSNYAFWMGYSWDNTLEGNLVEFSRWAGIAIEHGYGFVIRENTIRKNGDGIRLFTRGGAVTDYFPEQRICYDMTIENNIIEENSIGVNAYTGDDSPDEMSHGLHLRQNQFTNNRTGACFKRINNSQVTSNTFKDNLTQNIDIDDSSSIEITNNEGL